MFFRKSHFILPDSLSKTLGPPKSKAEQGKDAMMTGGGSAPSPTKPNQVGAVGSKCRCGSWHKPGSICSFDKSCLDGLMSVVKGNDKHVGGGTEGPKVPDGKGGMKRPGGTFGSSESGESSGTVVHSGAHGTGDGDGKKTAADSDTVSTSSGKMPKEEAEAVQESNKKKNAPYTGPSYPEPTGSFGNSEDADALADEVLGGELGTHRYGAIPGASDEVQERHWKDFVAGIGAAREAREARQGQDELSQMMPQDKEAEAAPEAAPEAGTPSHRADTREDYADPSAAQDALMAAFGGSPVKAAAPETGSPMEGFDRERSASGTAVIDPATKMKQQERIAAQAQEEIASGSGGRDLEATSPADTSDGDVGSFDKEGAGDSTAVQGSDKQLEQRKRLAAKEKEEIAAADSAAAAAAAADAEQQNIGEVIPGRDWPVMKYPRPGDSEPSGDELSSIMSDTDVDISPVGAASTGTPGESAGPKTVSSKKKQAKKEAAADAVAKEAKDKEDPHADQAAEDAVSPELAMQSQVDHYRDKIKRDRGEAPAELSPAEKFKGDQKYGKTYDSAIAAGESTDSAHEIAASETGLESKAGSDWQSPSQKKELSNQSKAQEAESKAQSKDKEKQDKEQAKEKAAQEKRDSPAGMLKREGTYSSTYDTAIKQGYTPDKAHEVAAFESDLTSKAGSDWQSPSQKKESAAAQKNKEKEEAAISADLSAREKQSDQKNKEEEEAAISADLSAREKQSADIAAREAEFAEDPAADAAFENQSRQTRVANLQREAKAAERSAKMAAKPGSREIMQDLSVAGGGEVPESTDSLSSLIGSPGTPSNKPKKTSAQNEEKFFSDFNADQRKEEDKKFKELASDPKAEDKFNQKQQKNQEKLSSKEAAADARRLKMESKPSNQAILEDLAAAKEAPVSGSDQAPVSGSDQAPSAPQQEQGGIESMFDTTDAAPPQQEQGGIESMFDLTDDTSISESSFEKPTESMSPTADVADQGPSPVGAAQNPDAEAGLQSFFDEADQGTQASPVKGSKKQFRDAKAGLSEQGVQTNQAIDKQEAAASAKAKSEKGRADAKQQKADEKASAAAEYLQTPEGQSKAKSKYSKTYDEALSNDMSDSEAHAAAAQASGLDSQEGTDYQSKGQKKAAEKQAAADAKADAKAGATAGSKAGSKASTSGGLPFSQMYGAGAGIGSSMTQESGAAGSTASFAAQRAHQLLNPDLRSSTSPTFAGTGTGARTKDQHSKGTTSATAPGQGIGKSLDDLLGM